MKVIDILEKAKFDHLSLTENDILQLLSVSNYSQELYLILSASNEYSRNAFCNRGYVFVQIGLNAEPCSGNCVFCSMGASHFSVQHLWRKKTDDVVHEIEKIDQSKVDDIFLMTTADYPMDEYLEVVRRVKPLLCSHIRLVANIGDFDDKEAQLLKEAGVTGAYHVNRLREGIDTSLEVETRVNTLNTIKLNGFELYYCIEPIAKEHTYKEIIVEMLRARSLKPEVMAVMRRVNIPSLPLSINEMVSVIELVKIAAVTNLVVRPTRAMNLHESEQMSLLAGVNQLYAEIGANPRDTCDRTEFGRGISVDQARTMFLDADYKLS